MSVELREVTVEETKEMGEVWDALAKITELSAEAAENGFQAVEDITKVAMGSFEKLGTAIKGVQKIPAEAKEKTSAFVMANAVGAARVTAAILDRPKAEEFPDPLPTEDVSV